MQTVLLVVDENTNIREFCKRELEREGYRVLLAADPYEALIVVDLGPFGASPLPNAERPDLVVTDVIEAPGVDFATFLRRVENRDVPVVVHTTDVPCLLDHLSWSVEACVEKSGDLADLKREIARALKRGATRRAALEDCEPMRSREWKGRSWDEDGID